MEKRKRDCRLKLSGERGRNRTFNLLIKSQLLCQLSYAPTVGIGGRTQTKIIPFTLALVRCPSSVHLNFCDREFEMREHLF
jgi:hypothetical protein